mgnify:CR=1 FL=1
MSIEAETEQVGDIDDLRHEIDRLDAEILAAVKRRTEVSRLIGKARMASGGTRLVHSREMKVIERYIFRRVFVVFAAALGWSLAIVWTTQVLTKIDVVTDSASIGASSPA